MGQKQLSGFGQRVVDNEFVAVDATIQNYKLDLKVTLKPGRIQK